MAGWSDLLQPRPNAAATATAAAAPFQPPNAGLSSAHVLPMGSSVAPHTHTQWPVHTHTQWPVQYPLLPVTNPSERPQQIFPPSLRFSLPAATEPSAVCSSGQTTNVVVSSATSVSAQQSLTVGDSASGQCLSGLGEDVMAWIADYLSDPNTSLDGNLDDLDWTKIVSDSSANTGQCDNASVTAGAAASNTTLVHAETVQHAQQDSVNTIYNSLIQELHQLSNLRKPM